MEQQQAQAVGMHDVASCHFIAISVTVVTPQLPWVAVCRVCRLPADLIMAIAMQLL